MILNAVLCVYNEEDIIESTIKHLFAQGCSNVFIIDNMSSDGTVEISSKAGGQLISQFESRYFDELQKIRHLNTAVRSYNESGSEENIWWLYVDADEFPGIDCDLTILDFLKQLDPAVRGVQGYFYNHTPTHPPYHQSPYHPADFQPVCSKSDISKIPLLRYDKNKPHIDRLAIQGGAMNVDICTDNPMLDEDIRLLNTCVSEDGELLGERLARLSSILKEMGY